MRVINFLLVASIFSIIFITVATISALATGVVHAQLKARPVSASIVLLGY